MYTSLDRRAALDPRVRQLALGAGGLLLGLVLAVVPLASCAPQEREEARVDVSEQPAVASGESQTEPAFAAVVQTSSKSFQQTVSALETALEGNGFMIVGRIDHQNMLRMVGARTGGSVAMEFGKPDMMKELLPENPEIGLAMPLRAYVYEDAEGGVHVSYFKPSSLLSAIGQEALQGPGMMMDQALAEVVATALR